MNKIIVLPEGSLASRKSAIPFRTEIQTVINDSSYKYIVLDLEKTESISGSFADELLGVLVNIYGWDLLKEKIRLSNGSGEVKASIAQAIFDRINV